MIFLVFNTQRT